MELFYSRHFFEQGEMGEGMSRTGGGNIVVDCMLLMQAPWGLTPQLAALTEVLRAAAATFVAGLGDARPRMLITAVLLFSAFEWSAILA